MDEKNASNVSHHVILSTSFIGGPRDMRRRYLNAMALLQRYGKLDLFITMTCNPNWDEIKRELLPGEKAQNRPDLVVPVFFAKLAKLKREIKTNKIFGPILGQIAVVEFQKEAYHVRICSSSCDLVSR